MTGTIDRSMTISRSMTIHLQCPIYPVVFLLICAIRGRQRLVLEQRLIHSPSEALRSASWRKQLQEGHTHAKSLTQPVNQLTAGHTIKTKVRERPADVNLLGGNEQQLGQTPPNRLRKDNNRLVPVIREIGDELVITAAVGSCIAMSGAASGSLARLERRDEQRRAPVLLDATHLDHAEVVLCVLHPREDMALRQRVELL